MASGANAAVGKLGLTDLRFTTHQMVTLPRTASRSRLGATHTHLNTCVAADRWVIERGTEEVGGGSRGDCGQVAHTARVGGWRCCWEGGRQVDMKKSSSEETVDFTGAVWKGLISPSVRPAVPLPCFHLRLYFRETLPSIPLPRLLGSGCESSKAKV